MLFNFYAERVMRDAALDETGEGIRIGGRIINNLRYADDVTLAAETAAGLESIIKRVVASSARAGLYLNVRKTNVLTIAGITSFKVNNEDIKMVQQFNHLGSNIGGDGGYWMEVFRRLALGQAAMNGLTTIWRNKDLRTATKARLVGARVFPVAM